MIRRLRQPPHAITLVRQTQTVYEVELSAAPSPEWRAAFPFRYTKQDGVLKPQTAIFLRPPPGLTTTTYTPDLGLGLDGARVAFRTTPSRLHGWLRRIDRWIEYANEMVEE